MRTARIWFAARATVNLGSSTVVRVITDQPDPEFRPRPVGFTAQLEPVEQEPQIWEGDGA